MKVWAWEENNEKQRKKRMLLWTVAVICWLAAIYFIHFIWKTMYGEVVSTHAVTIAAVSVGVAIGQGIRFWAGMEDPKPTKRRKIIEGCILGFCFLVLAYGAYFKGEVVWCMQVLSVCAVGFWMDWMKKKDIDRISLTACTVVLVAVLLVAGTLAGAKLTGIHTVKQAEKTIAAEGFSNVSYVRWISGRWVYQNAVQKSSHLEEMQEEKCYLFVGEKDGENWCIVIDPKSCDVIFAGTDKEEPELANWK